METIVVLDGYALNPGDLDWGPLEALGHCTVYERTAPDATVPRSRDATILVLNKVRIDGAVLDELPRLRYITVLATGYDNVDTVAARQRDIPVSNVPSYGTASVAQAVFGHLFNLTLATEQHARSVDAGNWFTAPDYCYWERPLVEVAGLTFGVVGFGRIGQAVARIARAFDMPVLVATEPAPASLPAGCRRVDVDTLFAEADVVSLHCPLTPQTASLVNAERLGRMKPSAYLINTGRGGLIDESALAATLRDGRIAGAALDVLSQEPPARDNPLLGAPHCRITPHVAWATRAARQRLLDVTVANVEAFLAGRPQNVL